MARHLQFRLSGSGFRLTRKVRPTMRKIQILNLIAAIAMLAATASADFIPYPNVGTLAPSTTFTATQTGPVFLAYFYAQDAGYNSTIGMRVNGAPATAFGLPNHSSAYGLTFNLGSVNAGDSLVFELKVDDLGYSWYSAPSLNSDLLNHAYATPWSGDSVIPPGTYVGFEDLPGGGDRDYNDHQFVFTNVSVPDGGMTLMLLGGALVGLETLRRKFRM